MVQSYPEHSGNDPAELNPFAGSQVAEIEAAWSDENFRLTRPIPLAGRGSLETMTRAVWETYGLAHRVRIWVWLSLFWAAVIYGAFAGWRWWWLVILVSTIALLVYLGIYVPWRIAWHIQKFAAEFDELNRGEVTDGTLVLEQQSPKGEWTAAFPDEPVIAWSRLTLLRLGRDYLLFLRRKERLTWLLSLPRQFFASDQDWSAMVEFAERKLLRPLVAPRCGKCKKRFSQSELQPMPWSLRLIFGQPFTSLGFLIGLPPARYCSGCWTSAYSRQITILIATVLVVIGFAGAFLYLIWG